MKISETFSKCWRCDGLTMGTRVYTRDLPDASKDIAIMTEIWCSDCMLFFGYGMKVTYDQLKNSEIPWDNVKG